MDVTAFTTNAEIARVICERGYTLVGDGPRRTIPGRAVCQVPDERFDFLCSEYKPASCIPAFLTITDIAGLVRGASSGEGLGAWRRCRNRRFEPRPVR